MTQRGNAATRTDADAAAWLIDDELLHLREWGTHRIYPLPPAGGALTIGAGRACALRLLDPAWRVSHEHARLSREHARWVIRDLNSRNGTRLDGARRFEFPLLPGVEVGIGRLTLIAESQALIALRGFLARLLGWSEDRIVAIDRALRALRTAATRRGALVVCGDGDVVPIAHSLHLRTIGGARPFVVCDPRRQGTGAPAARRELRAALDAATSGTLCLRARQLPRDLREVWLAFRDPSSHVRLVLCTDDASDARTLLADPIVVPPLPRRSAELGRIVDEYARDAITELAAAATGFSRADRDWVLAHSASTLPEIEQGARRRVALRQAGTITGAATRLGVSHVALSQWLGRRRLP
ncbi:MAG TPA: FHA domain-containing protein [Kofleriaceae bacterium]|nr:FHA domain-containing protein [Kofleriaceae bacterium]